MARNLEKRREYNKNYQRVWYKKNRALQIRRSKESKVKNREAFKVWKKTLKCERCPETFFACLDFHHTGIKENSISVMKGQGRSIQSIMVEAEKCIVLCANCHRKEHWKEKT